MSRNDGFMVKPRRGSQRWGQGTRQAHSTTGRELILAAAVECYAENGLSDTTIEQIAAKAKIARRTIYRYFPTRQAIIEAVIDRQGDELMAGMLASMPPATSDFVLLIEYSVLYIIENGPKTAAYTLLMGEGNLRATGEYYLKSMNQWEKWQAYLKEPFHAAQTRGEVPPDVELRVLVLWMGRLMLSWMLMPEPPEEIRRQIRMLLRLRSHRYPYSVM